MALLFLSLHRHTNMHISESLTRCSFTSQDLGMCSLNIRIICYITTVPVFRLSCSVVSDSLWPHGAQHGRLPCPSPSPGFSSNSCPLSQWCHPAILILCRPLLLLPSIFSSIRVFPNELALRIRWSDYWSFSFSFSISPSDEYSGLTSFRVGWVALCSPLAPQFKRSSSPVLSLLRGPAVAFLHMHCVF